MISRDDQPAEKLTRLVAKIRMVEDALERANDQLEGEPDEASWRYVRDQVDKAHDWVIDANAIVIAWMESWLAKLR